mgnify:FL=1
MTPRQRDVLEFIDHYWKQNHCAPSMEIICRELNMNSKSNIHRIIHLLIDDGYLSMKPNRPRTVRVEKIPWERLTNL